MSAYELAYKLTNALGVDYEMLEQSAIMLRQQADRIAKLESYLEAYKTRVAELEKQLNTPKTYVLDGKQIFDTTPQIKERCEPLCKPSVCDCLKKAIEK